MKTKWCKGCLGVLLFVAVSLKAQIENADMMEMEEMRYERQLHWAMTFGGSISLDRHSDNPAAAILGTPPPVAPAFDLRLSHLFAKHWGWYADFRLKYYVCKLEYGGMGEIFVTAFSPSTYFHVGYSAGGVFRIEGKRWQCYPRLGIGHNFYGYNRHKVKEERVLLESDGKTFCMDVGVSTQYHLTPHMALMIDVLYRQPFTSAKAYLSMEEEGGMQSYSCSSTTWGRELNVSLGLSFCFSLKRR